MSQFYLYAKYRGINILLETPYFHQYQNKLRREFTKKSILEETVLNSLKKIFETYEGKFILMDGCFAAGSTIDIAILSKTQQSFKVAIEVDGPTHYQKQGEIFKLNHNSRFKTTLLEAEGWKVIRLPYFEINKENDSSNLNQYLQGKIMPVITQKVNQAKEKETSELVVLENINSDTQAKLKQIKAVNTPPNTTIQRTFVFNPHAKAYLPKKEQIFKAPAAKKRTAWDKPLKIKPD